MNTKRRTLLVLVLFAILGLHVAMAAPAIILAEIKGKVEIKAAGSSTWQAASSGMELKLSDTISTGFDSMATVRIDKNVLHVKALSRLSVDKLSSSNNKVSTSTFLRVGRVDAEIQSAKGLTQDFKVQSPYSTASVRGTRFSFDGLKLKVREGKVAFIPGAVRRIEAVFANTEVPEPQDSDEVPVPDNDKTVYVQGGDNAILVIPLDGEFDAPKSSADLDSLREEANGGSAPGGSVLQKMKPVRPSGTIVVELVD